MRLFLTIILCALGSVLLTIDARAMPPACEGILNVLNPGMTQNDTVFVCVGTPTTFEDASILEDLLTDRDWDFGDGNVLLGALLSSQATHTYENEGVYTVQLTVDDGLLGCPAITVSQVIVVLGDPVFNVSTQPVSCFGDCNGEIQLSLVSDNASYYQVIWDVVGTPGNTISNLCAGEYSAAVTDGLGCTNLSSGTVTIPEPDLLVADVALGDSLQLCPDDGVTNLVLNLAGGTGTLVADWGTSPAVTQINAGLAEFTPSENSLNQTYHVVVQDQNGCVTQDSIFIGAVLSVLQGQVTVGSNVCNDCEVVKYKYNATPGLWEPLASTVTNSSGQYSFGAISNLLPFTIFANPNQQNHPKAPLGFYPQGHQWATANVLSNVCGLDLTKNITLEEPLVFDGTNALLGTVWYSSSGKMQAEDPIPLIDVVVEKTPPGQGQARVETNASGEYEFTLVPNSDTLYTLYVSMPGVPVTSTYEILANTGDEVYCELDFCLNEDSTEIYICNGNESPCETNTVTGSADTDSESGFRLYPNPNNGMFTIETGHFATSSSEVRIVDAMGRIVFQKHYEHTPYTMNIVNLAEGFYTVRIINEQATDITNASVIIR